MAIKTIEWTKNTVRLIDQRKLPLKLEYIVCREVKTLWQAIRTLSVRGAPALGVAAAFGVLLGLTKIKTTNRLVFEKELNKLCDYIGSSRPTAVNLFNALSEMKHVVDQNPKASVGELKDLLHQRAMAIFELDRQVCRQLGQFGAKLIKEGSRLLTICNAGALATVDYGTALGVMYAAKEAGRTFKVYCCETRPLLQGARLTAWELTKKGIDATLICDNMAASLMKQNMIDLVIAGADRIARNGDTANKIGTYNLAVLAEYHKIPFYIAAPLSTFDRHAQTGQSIPIEQREKKEVTHLAQTPIAPPNIKVYNPAFDVTDAHLIQGIITEKGILSQPLKSSIQKIL